LVGADTIIRVGDRRYYRSLAEMQEAIERIAAAECRFLVFGRQGPLGFRELHQMELPEKLATLCEGVSAARFRADISSTQIRRRRRRED
jgi:hypothetical protein